MGPFKKAQNTLKSLSSVSLLPSRNVIEDITVDAMTLIAIAKHYGLDTFSHSKCNKRRPARGAVDYLLSGFAPKVLRSFDSMGEKCCPFIKNNNCILYTSGVPVPHVCLKRFLKENIEESKGVSYIKKLDRLLNSHGTYLKNIVRVLGG